MGQFVFFILDGLIGLLEVAIIIAAVLSWLIAFNVMNDRHPILAPIRKIIPNLGAVDISPIIALLILEGARVYLLPWIFRPIIGLLGG